MQRVENDGIREINDLRDLMEAIQRDIQVHEARETVLDAERRERLAQMEAQNAQTDTAILDLEQKLQIAMLVYPELRAEFKGKWKEKGHRSDPGICDGPKQRHCGDSGPRIGQNICRQRSLMMYLR